MKKLVRIIVIVLLAMLLIGCKSLPPQVELQTIEREIEKLVPYPLPPDSANIYALFECDSLNNVVLKELSAQHGKNWQSMYSLSNGLFDFNFYKPPDTVYVKAKDRYVYKEIPVRVPVDVYKQTKWQIVRCFFGEIFLAICGIYLLRKLIKWKFKF